MRFAAAFFLLLVLACAVGCGSAGFKSSATQSTTPSAIAVTIQPVQPTSPAQIVASATSPSPIKKWQLSVDGTLILNQASSLPSISQAVPLSAGAHQITATAFNTVGNSGSASAAVSIGASAAKTLTVTLAPVGSASPATITAMAAGPNPLTGWALYVDSNLVYKQNSTATAISQSVDLGGGQHQIMARAWDTTGAYATATATADIAAASGASTTSGGLIPVPPSSAKTWSSIEEKSGWVKCGACAGNPGGTGPVGSYWFKQGVSSPALDGNSMEAYIGGYVPWADDLFVYKFGSQNWANHIIYTVHFLWNAPKTTSSNGHYVVQAVEFDSYLSTNGFKYMFGTQCDYGGGYWGIWDGPANKWQNTSLKCDKFPANQWHTITWYVERDQNTKKLHFVALQVDGAQHKIDTSISATGSSWGDDFGVQFQQDSDGYGNPWNEYVDQISATIW